MSPESHKIEGGTGGKIEKVLETLSEKLRSRFLEAAFLGTAAFLEACGGLRKEDIEAMPTSAIEDVMARPESYSNTQLVKVEGWPVFTGSKKDVYMVPIFKNKDNKLVFNGVVTEEFKVNTYDIHPNPDLNSPSLKARSKEGFVMYGKYGTLNLSPEEIAPHKSKIAGKLERITDKGGTRYVLEINGLVDKEVGK